MLGFHRVKKYSDISAKKIFSLSLEATAMEVAKLKKNKKKGRAEFRKSAAFLSADPTPFPTLQSNTSTSLSIGRRPPMFPSDPVTILLLPEPRAAAVRSVPAGTHSLLSDVRGDFFCSSSKNTHLKFKFRQPCFMH